MKLSAIIVFSILLAATGRLQAAPLFDADTAIKISLKGPLTTLMRERPEKEQLPFVLTVLESDSSSTTLDVKLRTRGNYRRDRSTCPFAPIRLNLKKKQVTGTIFEGQDKLKLVTHCSDKGGRYKAAVQREYLAYRIFNMLTDISFRARLLEITYIDTDANDREMTRFGFVLEDSDDLAGRIDRDELKIPETTIAALDPAYTNLVSVFQYLIANTDFSPIAAPPGEDCCHNTVLMGKTGELAYAVPYDFDISGFVNAPYATPNPRFKLRTVKQRLYRGRCVNNAELQATVENFQAQQSAIRSMIESHPYLDRYARRETLAFVDAFYRIIGDARTRDRNLVSRCLN